MDTIICHSREKFVIPVKTGIQSRRWVLLTNNLLKEQDNGYNC